jgi:oxaloacetate decarboxylase alpha subunit
VRLAGRHDRGVTSLTHMQVYSHQVPGGMISNLESQLKEQSALDRLPEVLEEIPIVRAEVGFPPLVTPMSQIVGTQAVLNVLSGRRWHIVPDEMKAYLRGKYGAAPGPVSPEIVELVLGGEQPIHVRPAEEIHEALDDFRDDIGELARSDEDVLSYALFPQTARTYLERHHIGPEHDVFGTQTPHYLTSQAQAVMDEASADRVKDILALVETSDVQELVIEEGDLKISLRKSATPVISDGYHVVRAPMVGTFYASPSPTETPFVGVGDEVTVGQTLCILEAMKLMNELGSDVEGVVRQVLVENGAAVEYGQELFAIETA